MANGKERTKLNKGKMKWAVSQCWPAWIGWVEEGFLSPGWKGRFLS